MQCWLLAMYSRAEAQACAALMSAVIGQTRAVYPAWLA